jgi:pimeloyl-ACP methyl ester carboxylesterase
LKGGLLALLLSAVPGATFAHVLPLLPTEFEASIPLGGVPQHVLIRGRPDAPLLVIVHGGPGVNENPLFRRYLAKLESGYQVVYWEQRATGRSLSLRSSRPVPHIPVYAADLGELVDFVTAKYHQQRVYIVAHSWGTIPAALYVMEHPERVAAYVAVSPMVDVPASEREGWHWALDAAQRRNDQRATRALERIGAPPHDVAAMLVSRKWVERLGGTFHQPMGTGSLLLEALKDDYTNLVDIFLFGRGNHLSLDALWPEIRDFRLPRTIRWNAPVAFVVGEYDHVTSPTVARVFFDAMEAPCKQWVAFPDSAHNPPYEEPARFAGFMLEALPRWANECRQGKLPPTHPQGR